MFPTQSQSDVVTKTHGNSGLCETILFNIFTFLMNTIMVVIGSDEPNSEGWKGIANQKLIISFNTIMMSLLALNIIVMALD